MCMFWDHGKRLEYAVKKHVYKRRTCHNALNCSRGGKMKGTFFEIFKLRTKPKTHYLFQWTSNLVELSAVHRLFKGFKGSRISFRPQSDRSVYFVGPTNIKPTYPVHTPYYYITYCNLY